MSGDVVQGAPGTTPGKWAVSRQGWDQLPNIVGRRNGKPCGIIDTLTEADAHQIAASPLLYAALKVCVQEMQWCGDAGYNHEGSEALEMAIAALAAARGETA